MNKTAVSETCDNCLMDNLPLVKTNSVEKQHEDEPDFPNDNSYHFAGTPPPSLRLAEKAVQNIADDVLSK